MKTPKQRAERRVVRAAMVYSAQWLYDTSAFRCNNSELAKLVRACAALARRQKER